MRISPTSRLIAVLLAGALAQPVLASNLSDLLNKAIENPDLVNSVVGAVQNTIDANRTIGPKEEKTLGDGMAANLLGAAPLVGNAGLQSYVNQVGRWVASQSEAPNLDWRFGVIDTPNVNSFATPGGVVLITRGLMDRLRNESELAGVLGHEITHVLRHHVTRAAQSGKGREAVANALQGVAQYKTDDARRQLGANVLSGVSEVYVRGLDKDDEFEADVTGMVLAARAGYNPYALVSVLQTLGEINPADGSVKLMFSTHPSPQARLDYIDRNIGSKLEKYAGGVENTARFRAATGR
ncbi:M48 family metalloprotease [Jeongeupia wiesaeckerbachi]|uniref:M48 family metalloprotease n=1 Tax=Jeongeupia wiesaeckerbachi TaxID=3051218 RepID=UPI003D80145B